MNTAGVRKIFFFNPMPCYFFLEKAGKHTALGIVLLWCHKGPIYLSRSPTFPNISAVRLFDVHCHSSVHARYFRGCSKLEAKICKIFGCWCKASILEYLMLEMDSWWYIIKLCVQYFFLGHFLLTHLLLDLIKRSTPARIVVVASVAHTWTGLRLDDINSEESYDPIKAYGQSKLANVLFARSLAKRLQGEAGRQSAA